MSKPIKITVMVVVVVGTKIISVPKVKNLGTKGFWSNKYFGQKKFCPKKCWSTKLKVPKKLGPKSFVKIGSVTS